MALIKRTPHFDSQPASISFPDVWRDRLAAVTCMIVAMLVGWHVLGFGSIDIGTPLVYRGDALHYQALYQATREEGLFGDVQRAGAPFGTSHLDFPNADALNLLLMRGLGVLTDNPFIVFNLFVLLSFALCALIGFSTYRRLGLGCLWAGVAALAFVALPFHFQRIGHVFYLSYFVAALAGWLALEIVSDTTASGQARARRWTVLIAALACSMFGAYFAFFSCLVILAAGLHASAMAGVARPALRAGAIAALISLGTMLNLAPAAWHSMQNGSNTEAAVRHAADSEAFGLKITQLLLPREGHRLEPLADLRDTYETHAPLSTENKTAALGIVGGIGFLALLAIPFLGRLQSAVPAILVRASAPTYAGLLFATIGGFGSLFALLVTPQLRGLNRISPFIAFFGILAAVHLLSALAARIHPTYRRTASILLPVALFAIVLFDQTSNAEKNLTSGDPDQVTKLALDREFFSAVERDLPPAAMVMQLPLMKYPEAQPQARLGSYELLTAFLHTRSIRWTFGAMRGRAEDHWQRIVDTFSPAQQVAALDALGFSGVVIDRRGYDDNGAAMEASLIGAGLLRKAESADAHRTFLALPALRVPAERAFAVAPNRGWSIVEHTTAQTWLWSSGDASLVVHNVNAQPRQCELALLLESYQVARTVTMWQGASKLAEQRLEPGVAVQVVLQIEARDMPQAIDVRTDAAAQVPANDQRPLAFRMIMSEIPLCK